MNYAGPFSPLAALAYGFAGLVGILVLMACWMVAIGLTNRLLFGPDRPADAASDAPAVDSEPTVDRT